MTLQEIITIIEGTAAAQPAVNMIVRNDVFRLNGCPDAKYAAFAWLQRVHRAALDDGLIHYGFTLFFVDRLAHDLSNQIDIQSTGVQVLGNIIRKLADLGIEADEGWQIQAFNQRFLDECAGVFANVTFSVPENFVCAETFPESNDNIYLY